jgi:hypothetical protein
MIEERERTVELSRKMVESGGGEVRLIEGFPGRPGERKLVEGRKGQDGVWRAIEGGSRSGSLLIKDREKLMIEGPSSHESNSKGKEKEAPEEKPFIVDLNPDDEDESLPTVITETDPQALSEGWKFKVSCEFLSYVETKMFHS